MNRLLASLALLVSLAGCSRVSPAEHAARTQNFCADAREHPEFVSPALERLCDAVDAYLAADAGAGGAE